MAIVIEDLSGLGRGIELGAGALAGALEKRRVARSEEKQRSILSSAIERADLTTPEGHVQFTQEALNAGIEPSVLTQVLKPYQPMLKETAKVTAASESLDEILGPKRKTVDEPSLAPTERPVDVISEVSEEETVEVEKPREPGMNPVDPEPLFGETLKSKSIQLGDGREINEEQVNALIASPYESHRRLGESAQKQFIAEADREYKENSQIRKENRARIRKFSEPYDDIGKIKNDVMRLEQVVDLIETDQVSLDDAAWRTVISTLLEDKGQYGLGELFQTEAQKKIYSLLRPFFGSKELGGSNPSTREVLLSLAALPSKLKGKDANTYVGQLLLGEAQIALSTAKEVSRLQERPMSWSKFQKELQSSTDSFRKEKGKELLGLQRMQLAKKITKNQKPKRGHVFMLTPSGSVENVLSSDVKKAKASGGRIINGK